MDKPPKGKHSTKGLGKKVPQESEFVKWRDDVIIPCGKPVTSSVKASELMYNEYIVYDTAQVSCSFGFCFFLPTLCLNQYHMSFDLIFVSTEHIFEFNLDS